MVPRSFAIFMILLNSQSIYAIHAQDGFWGVDVSPSTFLSAIYDVNPDIVGLSCLISGVYNSLRESIAFLKDNFPQSIRPHAYIVGGRIDRLIAKSVGADGWASDAMEGVRLCKKIISAT